jgi:hypothetical protein
MESVSWAIFHSFALVWFSLIRSSKTFHTAHLQYSLIMVDSPLSINASVLGILTFVVAVIRGLYARALSLGKLIESDDEIYQVAMAACQMLDETITLEQHMLATLRPGSNGHSEQQVLRQKAHGCQIFLLIFIYFLLTEHICTRKAHKTAMLR